MTFERHEYDYEWYQDIEDLRDAGYTVEQKSPWHFQVVGQKRVNIWPTKKKFMIEFGDGASYYTDVVDTVDQILNPKETSLQKAQFLYAEVYAPEEEDWEPYQKGIKEFRKKREINHDL